MAKFPDINRDKFIYKGNELKSLNKQQRDEVAQRIKSTFDKKRATFRNFQEQIYYHDYWIEYSARLIEFEKFFTSWNKKWANLLNSDFNDPINDFFSEANHKFLEMDNFLQGIRIKVQEKNSTEHLLSETLDHIDSKIKEGMNDLMGLKANLEISKSFKDHIQEQIASSDSNRKSYHKYFIITLISIPILIGLLGFFVLIPNYDKLDVLYLRIGMGIPLLLLSYFLYSQYRLNQLIYIKYTHLKGFLGGGATYMNEMCDFDGDTKKEVNLKLMNLFMEITDVFNVVKQTKHPAEVSFTNGIKLIDKLNVKNKS